MITDVSRRAERPTGVSPQRLRSRPLQRSATSRRWPPAEVPHPDHTFMLARDPTWQLRRKVSEICQASVFTTRHARRYVLMDYMDRRPEHTNLHDLLIPPSDCPVPNVFCFPNVFLPLHISNALPADVGDALHGDRVIGMMLRARLGRDLRGPRPCIRRLRRVSRTPNASPTGAHHIPRGM